MNIYFACSITGGRDFESIYRAITTALLSDGHEVPTAHLADSRVKAFEGQVPAREIYERDTAWIRTCEALVAEVSTPSHGVGYEVAYALSLGKPVLCVYREGQPISKMLTGNSKPTIAVKSYRDSEEAIAVIRSFLHSQSQL
ncbi:MAG: nucleoside 2-deoxyribosyltransferase [Chloroflexi bacterium]|nr:nucleoside 2-deoxyribosyltransferase [Chloroflexota bacterium]